MRNVLPVEQKSKKNIQDVIEPIITIIIKSNNSNNQRKPFVDETNIYQLQEEVLSASFGIYDFFWRYLEDTRTSDTGRKFFYDRIFFAFQ